MKKRIGAAILPIWTVIAMTPACHECTQAGCENGLTLHFAAALSAPGQYRMNGTIDGQEFTCQATLPTLEMSCSSSEWRVEAYAISPGESPKIRGLHLQANPANINITVERDGMNLGQATMDLAYETVRPNGDSCPPECHVVEKTLTLTP